LVNNLKILKGKLYGRNQSEVKISSTASFSINAMEN